MQIKKILLGLFMTAMVTSTALAQDAGSGKPGRGHFGHHRYGMMKDVNLTADQKAQLKSINEDFKKQMEELKKNEDITVREWKGRMQTIRKDHMDKIQGLLTADQKATIKKSMEDRGAKFQARSKERMEKMQKDLGLSQQQVDELKKNHDDLREKMKALHDNKSLTTEQKRTEIKEFRKQQHESLKSILTADQLKKLEEMRKSHGPKKPVL